MSGHGPRLLGYLESQQPLQHLRKPRYYKSLIDLHTHTDRSDGSTSPVGLLSIAREMAISALAITDHDTFAGYDEAAPFATAFSIDLICGIELSVKLAGQSVHLLAYFLDDRNVNGFRDWIRDLQRSRRERNVCIAARLRSLGFDINVEEIELRCRGMAGRPHFAQVMVERGYAGSVAEAFNKYLAAGASAYVDRKEPTFEDAVLRIREARGISSLAHPVRIRPNVHILLPEILCSGINGIEAYHSEHSFLETDQYLQIALRHNLLVTGGSDFHGSAKPDIALGIGRSQHPLVPKNVLGSMRQWGEF